MQNGSSLRPVHLADGNLLAAPLGFVTDVTYQPQQDNKQDTAGSHIDRVTEAQHRGITVTAYIFITEKGKTELGINLFHEIIQT